MRPSRFADLRNGGNMPSYDSQFTPAYVRAAFVGTLILLIGGAVLVQTIDHFIMAQIEISLENLK